MNFKIAAFLLSLTLIPIVGFSKKNLHFVFQNNMQGTTLYENEHPVYFYQKELKSPDGKMYFNNYLHPLFSLSGDPLTEEFPPDHPYHRGIFWAWHQIYVGSKSIGDGWVMEDFSQDVTVMKTKIISSGAQLVLNVLWKSSLFQDSKPFVREHTTILVHPLENGMRVIDFEIELKALFTGVSIGGSNDEKGYGGFCARIKNPTQLTFTSDKGLVKSEIKPVKAGPWMDISVPNGAGDVDGIAILCHSSTPNYPATWILRNYETSMQNIVYPGKDRVELSMNEPTVLRYRLIIHRGSSAQLDMKSLQSEYELSNK